MFDLYKDLIIDHGVNPRNKYVMDKFTYFATGFNFFCGDKFDIYLYVEDNNIINVSFTGVGCSVSTASASLLTIYSKKKSINDVKTAFIYFNSIIKNSSLVCYDKMYADLNILSIVRNYPTRVKCATLIWHTLFDALKIDIVNK